MIEFDIRWILRRLLLIYYLLGYVISDGCFKDRYYDKKAGEGYEQANDYYVPISPWLKHRHFRILLWKFGWLIKYPNSKTGVTYANYRQLQCTIVLRVMVFLFLVTHIALLICEVPYAGICVLIFMILYVIVKDIFAYPVLRHDVKRLKSYQYIVANDDEAVLSDARRNPPRLWKINTLLDVFFYFGEARIRYCESGNYLVYRLKNGNLLYIFLKESFETMPEIHYEPYDWRRYNPAIGIWIDEIIVLDGNKQNDEQLLAMKNIQPQDLPENIC